MLRKGVLLAIVVACLTACGGGGPAAHPLGEKVVVKHTEIGGSARTTLGITVLNVREGTQDELKARGFEVDAEDQSKTPYYVDVRYANQGNAAIKRNLGVSLEDEDGNLITSTVIFDFGGGKPFAKCPQVREGQLAPAQTYESCTLFLVPEGKKPSRVSFLPNDPGHETDFVYWEAA